jgi:hypothetical protein
VYSEPFGQSHGGKNWDTVGKINMPVNAEDGTEVMA